MKYFCRVTYLIMFFMGIQTSNAQRPAPTVKDIPTLEKFRKLEYLDAPIRFMLNVRGVSVSGGGVCDLQTPTYNTGNKITIDVTTETITFKEAGLYHLEGSLYTFFNDNNSHEISLDLKINGEFLGPLDFKTIPSNMVSYSSTSLKFQNDIYFAAGTTVQLVSRYGSIKNLSGFFSANYVSP